MQRIVLTWFFLFTLLILVGAPDRFEETGNMVPGFHDTDDFTESFILEFTIDALTYYLDLAVGKWSLEEMYTIQKDPYCLNKLTSLPALQDFLIKLRKSLI